MRKLRAVDNSHAELARFNKAMKLAAAIRLGYGPINQEVLDALPTQPNDWWVSLAKAAEVRPPSPATVEAVIGLLTQELPMHDSPLKGLR